MQVYKGIQQLSSALKHPAATIGNFDGVHLGHQEIVRLALSLARARDGVCVAYTFRPHPQIALRPDANVQLLSTYDEKLELLERLGVDVVIEEPFSREFSTTSAERFFNDVLLRRLCAENVVVGYDFSFGNKREGHLEELGRLCTASGVGLHVVQAQKMGGEVVSSSRIRQHLLVGNMREATALLGRPFSYRGVVIKGDGRGRTIGFPTANLRQESKLALPHGVYATWAMHRNKRYPSVTNLGVRPTFETSGAALVETHFLGESIDLYGSTIEVQFVRKLRDERKFSGVVELKEQIGRDVEAAKRELGAG